MSEENQMPSMIKGNNQVYCIKVALKDLYLARNQGINLKHTQTLQNSLRCLGGYFPPLHCQKRKDRYQILEGHHRYVAYLAANYKDCWITYED